MAAKLYKFFVDGREFSSPDESITGAKIKELAGVPAGYQLYLEEEGHTPDKAISDGETVNLEGREKHFFAVPPATFGSR